MNPKPLLHLEGTAIFALGIAEYRFSHGNWWLFALLFLAPDLSMIGYTFNARVGAVCYNAFHTYTAPVLLAVFGHLAGNRRVFRSPSSGSLTLASIGCSVSA